MYYCDTHYEFKKISNYNYGILNLCEFGIHICENETSMVQSRPNGLRSRLWSESVWSQVSNTAWIVWTIEFFYHKSIYFFLKVLFCYHNSIQIINFKKRKM